MSTRLNSDKLRKQVQGRHCVVTGGSQGLGKAIAEELVLHGAHVTIVSRSVSKLEKAIQELERSRQNEDQRIEYKSCDLSSMEDTSAMMENMMPPHWLICNAGSAVGGFLPDCVDYTSQMSSNYVSGVNTLRALVRSVTKTTGTGNKVSGVYPNHKQQLPERVVFVGSVCSLLSMIGFTAYCASKYALRGFTDGLRQEWKVLGSKVHLYLPGILK
jgi:3-dehydrosphinganine reductase